MISSIGVFSICHYVNKKDVFQKKSQLREDVSGKHSIDFEV